MSLLGKLLLNPEKLFRRTLSNIDQISHNLSKDAVDGVGLMGSAVIEDLFRAKVISADTHRDLQAELRAWHRAKTGRGSGAAEVKGRITQIPAWD